MNVSVYPAKKEGTTKAFVTAAYGPEGKKVYLKGMKIMAGPKGLFLAMPSTKLDKPYVRKKDGKQVDYEDHFFMDADLRKEIFEEAMRLMPKEDSFVGKAQSDDIEF